jgi:F-type H+-transporting ATPase subunit epsilon
MKTVPVEIVTPERVFLKEDAEFVVIPGYSGELGILPGHARLLALLVSGTMRLQRSGNESKYMISGGVAFIEPHLVKIFTTLIRPA